MNKIVCLFCSMLLLYGCSSTKEIQIPGNYGTYTLLPNGWKLSPAGENVPIGELPLNMLITRDGRYAVTSNSGAGEHSISLISLEEKKEIQRIVIDKHGEVSASIRVNLHCSSQVEIMTIYILIHFQTTA